MLALLAVAVWFRFWKLDHLPGVNGDEAWYGIQASRLLQGESISTQTPTGNPVNLLFLLPHLLLHALAEPSFALLRLPAVLSGLAALLANFWLCRGTFDQPTAIASTVILAVLPINIAYSRFSWDPAQTLLVSVVVLYMSVGVFRAAWACLELHEKQSRLSLRESTSFGGAKGDDSTADSLAAADRAFRKQLLLAAIAWAVAILVHPTNVFLGPLVVLPAVIRWRAELWQWVNFRQFSTKAWLTAAVGAALLLVVAWGGRHWLVRVGERFTRPGDVWEFSQLYVQLFWGVSSYQYLAGSVLGEGWQASPLNIAGYVLAAALACLLARYLIRQRPREDLAIAAAYLIGLLGFFLVGGPPAIAPHYERYAMWLIAPAALLVARGMAASSRRLRWMLWQPAIALAALMLMVFGQNYFGFVADTGGASHRAFRTAALEPKLVAWQQATRQLSPGEETLIGTSEYWTEKPLAYLAANQAQTRIVRWQPDQPWPAELAQAAKEGRACFVEYLDGPGQEQLYRNLTEQRLDWDESRIADYAGRPLLVVVRPRAKVAFRSAKGPAFAQRKTTIRLLEPAGLVGPNSTGGVD